MFKALYRSREEWLKSVEVKCSSFSIASCIKRLERSEQLNLIAMIYKFLFLALQFTVSKAQLHASCYSEIVIFSILVHRLTSTQPKAEASQSQAQVWVRSRILL